MIRFKANEGGGWVVFVNGHALGLVVREGKDWAVKANGEWWLFSFPTRKAAATSLKHSNTFL